MLWFSLGHFNLKYSQGLILNLSKLERERESTCNFQLNLEMGTNWRFVPIRLSAEHMFGTSKPQPLWPGSLSLLFDPIGSLRSFIVLIKRLFLIVSLWREVLPLPRITAGLFPECATIAQTSSYQHTSPINILSLV